MRRLSVGAILEPLLVATGLALAVSYRFFEPIWRVEPGLLMLGFLTALAYLAGRVAYGTSKQRGVGRALWVTVVVSQPILLTLWLLGLPVSRIALICELALLCGFLVLATRPVPKSLMIGAASIFAAVAAYPSLVGALAIDGSRSVASVGQRYVFSGYHDLSIDEYTVLEGAHQDGGAITTLPDGRVLLVAGSGQSRILDLTTACSPPSLTCVYRSTLACIVLKQLIPRSTTG